MKQARRVAGEPDISLAHPEIGAEEKRAVLQVLESGQLAQGPVVAEFEAAFARWIGVKHAVAVSSGTAGLHLALLAHGIGTGDEVITTPFTFIASANSVLFTQARPVFADVEPNTFCIDPTLVERAITPRSRAILPVHLYGHPAAMPELADIARRHSLVLIEDACQAHGATVHGTKVGALGHTAVFSLYPTKNMTSGEGGFVTTHDPAIASAVRTPAYVLQVVQQLDTSFPRLIYVALGGPDGTLRGMIENATAAPVFDGTDLAESIALRCAAVPLRNASSPAESEYAARFA